MDIPVYPVPVRIEGTTPRPDFVKALEGCLDYLWDGTRINRYNDGGVFCQRFICFALESVWSRQLALISVPALELLKYEIGVRLSASMAFLLKRLAQRRGKTVVVDGCCP